jgi:DNA-binding NarL/FixJ family response regulator
MTAMVELLDWSRLPTESQEIASMLARGWTQEETARLLGYAEKTVLKAVATLREAMLCQLAERDDELARRLRERAEQLWPRSTGRAA